MPVATGMISSTKVFNETFSKNRVGFRRKIIEIDPFIGILIVKKVQKVILMLIRPDKKTLFSRNLQYRFFYRSFNRTIEGSDFVQ